MQAPFGTNRIPLRLPPREVTSIDVEGEVEPRSVGVERAPVERIWQAVEHLYAAGVHPAMSLCVRRRGRIVLNRAIGHVRGNVPEDGREVPKVPVFIDTPFCIFSASKAITAIVLHLLDERGMLHLGDRVADYIPEFGQKGKESVTLRHVLTHRAGLPTVPAGHAVLDLLAHPEAIVDLLCKAELTSTPGRRLAYHAVTGGFILGEVVRRVTGRTIREVLRDEILGPLGYRDSSSSCSTAACRTACVCSGRASCAAPSSRRATSRWTSRCSCRSATAPG